MVLGILLFAATVFASPVDQLGSRLIELRSEVEQKGRDLQEAQKDSSSRLESYIQRQSELEAQVRKEEMRKLQLIEKTKALKIGATKIAPATPQDYAALAKWVERLDQTVRMSLPFRRTERLATVEALRLKVFEKRESPVTLASELWTLTERELKLTSDNEFLIGKIDLDGQTVDAEIARIGMIQMMFKTSKGEKGYALRQKEGWKLVRSDGGEMDDSIDRTLKKFKERNSSGWFEVPGLASLVNGGAL